MMSRLSSLLKNRQIIVALAVVLVVSAGVVGFIFKDNISGLFNSNSLAPLKYVAFKADNEDRWGILELSTGKIVIENEWENVPSIESDGIIKVRNKNNLAEFFKVGEKPVHIGDEYRYATDFSDGLAVVARDKEYITVINTDGKEVLKLKELDGKQVEKVGAFKQGVAAFQDEDGKWGFVNKDGKVVIKAKYDSAGEFNEGLAMVVIKAEPDNTVSFINKSGKDVIKLPRGTEAKPIVSEGMIIYSDNGRDTYGVMDIKGDKIIKPSKDFRAINYFKNGLASFYDGDRWGVIDKKGEVVVRAKYDYATPDNGMILVVDRGKTGYLSYDNEEVIRPDYERGMPFYGKNTIVKDGNKFIIIDKKGEQVGKMDFAACNFQEIVPVYNHTQTSYVSSDFFDSDMMANMIIQNVSKSQINGISKNTTLATIMKTFDIQESALPNYGTSLTGSQLKNMDKYASVIPEFNFEDSVSVPVEQVNTFSYGASPNYHPNYETKVSTVIYRIQFTSSKALNKDADIFKSLKAKIENLGYKTDSDYGSNSTSVKYVDDQGRPVAAVVNTSRNSFTIALRLT